MSRNAPGHVEVSLGNQWRPNFCHHSLNCCLTLLTVSITGWKLSLGALSLAYHTRMKDAVLVNCWRKASRCCLAALELVGGYRRCPIWHAARRVLCPKAHVVGSQMLLCIISIDCSLVWRCGCPSCKISRQYFSTRQRRNGHDMLSTGRPQPSCTRHRRRASTHWVSSMQGLWSEGCCHLGSLLMIVGGQMRYSSASPVRNSIHSSQASHRPTGSSGSNAEADCENGHLGCTSPVYLPFIEMLHAVCAVLACCLLKS